MSASLPLGLDVFLTAVKALSLEDSRGSVNTGYKGLDPHVILMCAIPTFTVACQAPLSMGFLQARILEWVAISSPRGSPQPRDRTCVSYVSCIAGRFFIRWAIREAQDQHSTEYTETGPSSLYSLNKQQ